MPTAEAEIITLGGLGHLARRFAEEPGSLDSAGHDSGLPRLSPAGANVLSGQVDDGVDALEISRVEPPRLRIPSDLSGLGRAPDQGSSPGGLSQPDSTNECAADEPACSAHCHAE